jgi:hypothetical protein
MASDWSSEAVANTLCSVHGHGIETVISENGKKEVTRCSKCGLSLDEIRAGIKVNSNAVSA